MKALWSRYILLHFLKLFAFFLASFYVLYVVIDYATHMQDFVQSNRISVVQLAFYYFLQFIKRADILVPLSVLIATIRTLTSLNSSRELLAFQSAGISQKKLLRPLFVFSCICSVAILSLNEWIIPLSLNKIDSFHGTQLHGTLRRKDSEPIRVIHLSDHSRLIYQCYDPSKEVFCDVVWLRAPDDLWRMKSLRTDLKHPEGLWVDHFERNSEGILEKTHSSSRISLPELKLDPKLPELRHIPLENRSISSLWASLQSNSLLSSPQRHEALTQLLFKITCPLLTLLAFIGVAPYCIRFSRWQNIATTYAIALFGLVGFIAYLDSAVILGESATISPIWGIVSPFILLLSMLGLKFSRS